MRRINFYYQFLMCRKDGIPYKDPYKYSVKILSFGEISEILTNFREFNKISRFLKYQEFSGI
jgi:hypothetical protein